ncbi:hypothetical protein PR202_ga28179 [Eleusine coracana subsp. coracana]|uniref:Uncharacterized protein n=1 Tax=Eleusine coracana subsp. coracana TaxID=191504 RepID=A0AAV5DI18_ELECO|nr:hypothetical protein PR202_ga28179 [Eleusine coracana subsp. coracana]
MAMSSERGNWKRDEARKGPGHLFIAEGGGGGRKTDARNMELMLVAGSAINTGGARFLCGDGTTRAATRSAQGDNIEVPRRAVASKAEGDAGV